MSVTRSLVIWLAIWVWVPASYAAIESCDPIKTFADGKVPRREIYVGSDTQGEGDGSESAPYANIRLALREVRPGDAIRMLPGEYRGGITIERVTGTEAAPIWIGGIPGRPRPVIRGGGGGLLISRVRHVVVENLEVVGASGNGINCDDGGEYANGEATRFVLFRNLSIREIGTGGNHDGLKLSGVNDFFVLDCAFERISAGGSAVDHVGCHRGLIARCSFLECGNGVQCKGGSEDIEIRWNRFKNAGGRAVNIGGSTGFAFFRPPLSKSSPNYEAKNVRVLANTFEGSDAPVAFVGTVDSMVANNTIIEPVRWIARILQETNSKDGYEFLKCGRNEFSNNLVWYRRGAIGALVNVGANTDAASFTFQHNLWYAHDQPARSQGPLPVQEVNPVAGQDPLFADFGAKDYSVLPTSPAAGKGKRIPAVKGDQRERCFGDPPTIGAFEARADRTKR